MLDRLPPTDLDAERCLLGSILLRGECLDDCTSLKPEDFWDDAHQRIYRHMVALWDDGKPIDAALLMTSLKKAGDWETIGGASTLAKLASTVANAAHARFYASAIAEKSTLRRLIAAGSDIVTDAYDSTAEIREQVGKAEERIYSIGDVRSVGETRDIASLLQTAMQTIDKRIAGEVVQGQVASGFRDLDKLTGGFRSGELIIVAGRPSMGKTAFALNVAEQVAEGDNVVLVVSLEMSCEELTERMLCSRARISTHRVRDGYVSREERERLVMAAGEIARFPLFVEDSAARNVIEIAAACRRLKRKRKRLDLLVIDYLQLIDPIETRANRQEQVAAISRRLKHLARQMGIPVVCLAQLNRQAEDARDHRPRLSHLRESGAIEQDADVVMFVHRESYYLTGELALEEEGKATLIVAKQRNGPIGDVELQWEKQFTRFQNLAPERVACFDVYNQQDRKAAAGDRYDFDEREF